MPALADIARTGGPVGRFNNSGQNKETTLLVSGSLHTLTVATPLACRSGLLLRPNFRNPFLGRTPASPVERRSRKSAAHSARYPGAGGGLSSPCWKACNPVDGSASMDKGATPFRSTNSSAWRNVETQENPGVSRYRTKARYSSGLTRHCAGSNPAALTLYRIATSTIPRLALARLPQSAGNKRRG